MFVNRPARHRGKVDFIARGCHFSRECRRLPHIHARKTNRHEHRCHLIVGNCTENKILHHIGDRIICECFTALLLCNEIIHPHNLHSFCCRLSHHRITRAGCAGENFRPSSSALHERYRRSSRQSSKMSGMCRDSFQLSRAFHT